MLSIAIPTMRRWTFLKDSLPQYLQYDSVKEVVVCDETGEDAKEILSSSFANHPKLKVVVNEKQLGIYFNKRKAGLLCTAPYVAILDSDNIFTEQWFEVLFDELEKIQEKQSLDTCTLMFGSATFKSITISSGQMKQPCSHFEGLKISSKTWNEMFSKPYWNHLLNDGNWVVPRKAILSWPLNIPSEYEAGATYCDALYSLRCMIQAGYTIYYLPDLEYIHTVHSGSSWLTRETPSNMAISTTQWKL